MIDNFLDELSQIYNIKFINLEQYTEKGYRNKIIKLTDEDEVEYNLVIYKDEEGILKTIRNANFVSNYLAKKDFPTRYLIKTKNDKSIVTISRQPLAISLQPEAI